MSNPATLADVDKARRELELVLSDLNALVDRLQTRVITLEDSMSEVLDWLGKAPQ